MTQAQRTVTRSSSAPRNNPAVEKREDRQNSQAPAQDGGGVREEFMAHYRESVKRNHRLGELLAK